MYRYRRETAVTGLDNQFYPTCPTILQGFGVQTILKSNFLEAAVPVTPRIEKHFTSSESVRDVVSGRSDRLTTALTIAGADISGGVIPLSPSRLAISVSVALAALAIFGHIKGAFTVASPIRSAIQTVLIGGVAAAMAFVIARAITIS
jgi:hypothetical protein